MHSTTPCLIIVNRGQRRGAKRLKELPPLVTGGSSLAILTNGSSLAILRAEERSLGLEDLLERSVERLGQKEGEKAKQR
jgi:hypothetical protein